MKPISNHSIRKVATLILMLLTLSALQAGEAFRKDTLLSLPDRNPIKCDISASQSEIELNIYFNLDVDHKAGISFYSPNPKDYTLQLFRLRDNLMEEYALPLRKWIPMVDSVFYAYVPAGNFLARITRSGNTTAHRLHIALVVDPMGPLDAAEAPIACLPLPEKDPKPPREPNYGREPGSGITPGRSYIRQKQMLNEAGSSYLETLCYFDGLGRPVQTVKRKFTPSQSDLVDFIDYDDQGRAWRRWLPVPIAGKEGAFIHNLPQKAAPLWGDPRPYEETLYEPSPLNRPALETKAGQDWKDHPSRVTYAINSESGESACCRYQVNNDGALVKNGNYPAGTLHLTRMVNEDRAVSLIFTDKQGRTILQRNKDGNTSHDTYYVYDRRHLLRYVLPPMIGDHITLDHLDLYAFQYRYDGLGRCVEQKRPGCQPTMYVYDQADHRVFTQDGNQRPLHEWTCTFSDALGREVVTGLYISATAPPVGNSIVKAIPETSGATLLNSGYTVSGLNGSPQKLLSVCYYDNYDFLNLPSVVGLKAQLDDSEEAGYGKRYVGTVPAIAAQGKLTGSRTWIPESNQELITVFYYDDKGRVVQKRSTNHLAGKESQCFAYTFTGKPTKIKSVHFVPNKAEQTQVYTYAYGISERLISVTHQLNNHPPIKLAEYTYDEQGRISAKKLHAPMPANSPFAQTCSYLYNIQSWPTSLSAAKFTQKLSYANGPGTPCYSGNISSMTWKSGNEPTVRGYKFSYDGLSRLTQSHYGESEGINANAGRFNEVVTAYDLNGNICSLQRSGKTSDTGYGTVDALAIVHRGNQLKSVDDAAADPTFGGGSNFTDGSKNSATEYVYDGNGNLTQDFNKKIAKIQYNLLNLPNTLQWTNGNATSYLYSADGIKRRVTHQTASGYVGVPMGSLVPLTASQIAQTTTTDYCGNVIYENGVLSRILTEEGYITLSGTTPTYHYYLKDHQGNNRVVMSQSGVVEQVNHYYPFGGLFAEGTAIVDQPYKYNGKELDRKHGLDWYDYGARQHDAVLGRFTTVDPMSERLYAWSPYVYCLNSPVKMIDPTGKYGETAWDVFSLVTGVRADELKKIKQLDKDKHSRP